MGLNDKEKAARKFMEAWVANLDIRKMLLEIAVREGVALRHPDTGKWHDKSGLGFDSYEDLEKYGDAFIFNDPQPEFRLR